MTHDSCREDAVKARTGVGGDIGNASGLCERLRSIGKGGLGSWLKEDKSSLGFTPWGLDFWWQRHSLNSPLSIFGSV